MTVRENIAGDVLASLTTMQWNIPSKAWTGGAVMADASLNRRMTVRLAEAVAYAQANAIPHQVFEPHLPSQKPKSYADNFRFDRRIPWSH